MFISNCLFYWSLINSSCAASGIMISFLELYQFRDYIYLIIGKLKSSGQLATVSTCQEFVSQYLIRLISRYSLYWNTRVSKQFLESLDSYLHCLFRENTASHIYFMTGCVTSYLLGLEELVMKHCKGTFPNWTFCSLRFFYFFIF